MHTKPLLYFIQLEYIDNNTFAYLPISLHIEFYRVLEHPGKRIMHIQSPNFFSHDDFIALICNGVVILNNDWGHKNELKSNAISIRKGQVDRKT